MARWLQLPVLFPCRVATRLLSTTEVADGRRTFPPRRALVLIGEGASEAPLIT